MTQITSWHLGVCDIFRGCNFSGTSFMGIEVTSCILPHLTNHMMEALNFLRTI
jgi:hypothetical protein